MSRVLAFSVPLAEEVVSQTSCFGERPGIRGITAVHHLIDGEESLVASLLSLSEFLGRKRKETQKLMFVLIKLQLKQSNVIIMCRFA